MSWYVYASTNETIEIDRADRRGLLMPPRWGKVFVGEPFSSQHRYTNYILANPDSVLLGDNRDEREDGDGLQDEAQRAAIHSVSIQRTPELGEA